MLRLFLAFLAVVAVALAAVWLVDHPGSVEINFGDRTLWIAHPIVLLVGLLALLGVSLLLYAIWRWLKQSPGTIGRNRRTARQQRGHELLNQGLVAIAAGDAKGARSLAQKSQSLLGEGPLPLLLTAQAARVAGDEEAAEKAYQAMLDRPDTEFLALRGLVAQAEARGDRDAAIDLAGQALALKPDAPWMLNTMLELQTRARDWGGALATLNRAAKQSAIAGDDANRRRALLLLGRALAAEAEGQNGAALSDAEAAHKAAPDQLGVIVVLVRLLVAAAKGRRAAKLIAEAWGRTPHPGLAESFLAIAPDEPAAARAKRVAGLVASNPEHAESRALLAEQALAAEDWTSARTALEAGLAAAPDARLCRLMAELEKRGFGNATQERDWLVRAASARPDPAWACEACGHKPADVTPVCPVCDGIGTVGWHHPDQRRRPPLAATQPPAALPGLE